MHLVFSLTFFYDVNLFDITKFETIVFEQEQVGNMLNVAVYDRSDFIFLRLEINV